jgi:hypothetical protein
MIFLILVINFYYIINKLIILVPNSHLFCTGLSVKVILNGCLHIFNH